MSPRPGTKIRTRIWTYEHGALRQQRDTLATEEPLEIRLMAGGEQRSVAVTMRTPGADFELVAGFLFAEGVVRTREEMVGMTYCVGSEQEQRYNTINVELRAASLPDLAPLERHYSAGSACGVCGKTSLEALQLRDHTPPPPGPHVPAEALLRLPEALRREQGVFASTGGLHAAALFDVTTDPPAPRLLALREDVGRHNALDKLIGWALLDGRLPLQSNLVLVSGRASYEIMQKCLAAGVPLVCAISAPSSLAVDLARAFGITLVGFLRGERFNVYAGQQRIGADKAR
jgi:FdhD protein